MNSGLENAIELCDMSTSSVPAEIHFSDIEAFDRGIKSLSRICCDQYCIDWAIKFLKETGVTDMRSTGPVDGEDTIIITVSQQAEIIKLKTMARKALDVADKSVMALLSQN